MWGVGIWMQCLLQFSGEQCNVQTPETCLPDALWFFQNVWSHYFLPLHIPFCLHTTRIIQQGCVLCPHNGRTHPPFHISMQREQLLGFSVSKHIWPIQKMHVSNYELWVKYFLWNPDQSSAPMHVLLMSLEVGAFANYNYSFLLSI